MKIKEANAVYTGGGIWLFHGILEDGTFFLSGNEGYVEILTNDPSVDFDESLFWEWQEAHLVRHLYDDERVRFCEEIADTLLSYPYGDDKRGGITDDEIIACKKYMIIPV